MEKDKICRGNTKMSFLNSKPPRNKRVIEKNFKVGQFLSVSCSKENIKKTRKTKNIAIFIYFRTTTQDN